MHVQGLFIIDLFYINRAPHPRSLKKNLVRMTKVNSISQTEASCF